ncbi:ATP-binding protein [Hyalangium minutum]|uniref:histidine kinase n=1 Tax=Hyalangium minutum TaxID=394096 RepID=A0A085W6I0_9BACT|nr:ATP-binding protein [Hyalangium minutum]KFE63293.1 multi-sensor signal transduction histidine kinase [Hyalangium minutum]
MSLFTGGGELGARMRAMDWSQTPLGPVETWPQSLKTCLRVILTSRQPMFVWWGDSLINLYNDAYKAIVGGKHPQALGQPASVVWREIWDQVGPRAASAMRANEGTYDEALLLIMERNGYPEETYYTFSYSPVPNEQGGPGGILCANSDDTQRIIGERQLVLLRELAARTSDARTLEEVCRRASESLSTNPRDIPFALLYLTEPDGRTVSLAGVAGIERGHRAAPESASLEDRSGWPFAQVLRNHEAQLIEGLESSFGSLPTGGWPRPTARAMALPIASTGQTGRAGILIVGLNPFRLLDEGYQGFLGLASGQIAASLANAQAYTEEKKRAEALAELDRTKTAFFSNVSHEFRTPLTLMLGPTEDALASPSRALTGADLETVYRNELRLLKLVNTLLDFSRIEAGRMQAAYEPTDLSTLTKDLASAFRSAIERGGLRFEVDCPPLSEPVHVDRGMWEKIVLNLLSNAFKFTFEGSIRISLRAAGDHVELEVQDTGPGIPEAELPRVFERFHRIEGTRSRTHEGSGIGLALVQDLARLHGGSIRVTSQLGQGSRFTVSIPTGTAHLPAERMGTGRSLASTAVSAESYVAEAMRWLPGSPGEALAASSVVQGALPRGRVSTPARVLVVDDNADMREYIARLLGQHWTVETAADGMQALAAIRERPPDVVLTDVMMPNLDGFGLLQALRADPLTVGIGVIMLSARAGEESRVDGLRSGADDYLVKPFSAKELVARVAAHLELARLRRQAEAERHRFKSMLMDVPALITFFRGPELIFEFAHPLSIQALGGREVRGKPLLEAVPEFRGQDYPELILRVFHTGEPFYAKERLAKFVDPKTGEFRDTYWNITYLPVRSAAGEIDGVMTFDFDVTDQVLARKKVEALMEELKATDRRKDEFLAMLAHELRNPLAPLQTSLHLIRKRLGPSPVDRQLEVALRQASHLARIVDDLLEVSRITRGKIELRKERVDLGKAVSRALDATREHIESRKHDVSVSLPMRPLHVLADPVRVDQVLMNLITNAAKYTDTGGRIWVSIERSGDLAELRIRDNGIGIPDDLKPHLFELFQQGNRDLSRTQGGLGIGLTIVHKLVELHGGTVEARSEGTGKGSEFIVRIPLQEEEAAALQASGSQARVDERRAVEHCRVLVVDDNKDAAESLGEFIQDFGHEARVALDGTLALKVTAEWQPDLVFLDIGLPGLDGYQVAAEIRGRGGRQPILVALTGYGQESDRMRSKQAGFDHHLVKPPQIRELEAILTALRCETPPTSS